MSTAARLLALDVEIEGLRLERAEVETTAGWRRVTTTVVFGGAGCEGRGEDISYDPIEHEGFPTPDLIGRRSLSELSHCIGEAQLWPVVQPEYHGSVDYRLWAFESAALDLALRQAETTLGEALDREYRPVRFVISGVSDPAAWLAANDSLEFKLDVSMSWDDAKMHAFAATDRIRVLDFKAYYDSPQVEAVDDPAMYARVAEIFPNALLEDAALNDVARAALEGALERLSFDAPIHALADVLKLAIEPRHLNIKPSRFGTIERLFGCIDWCEENDVSMYGGGQFELGVGREQIQALASLFYADNANDVAPAEYNTAAEPRSDLQANPLPAPARLVGFAFGSE